MSPRYLGVDLGGTGTRVVLTDGTGEVLTSRTTRTSADPGGAVRELGETLAEVASGSVAGIGIGASGPIGADGVIRNPDTLPAYTGIDVVGALEKRFGVPVHIDNDAVTAAYGEVLRGAGQGARAVLMITLGTGVGVAMLNDGVPMRTGAGAHPEAGHLWVPGHAPCYCGRESCWEQVASRSALESTASAIGLDLNTAVRKARLGESEPRGFFAAYGRAVGTGLADLIAVLGPEVVLLGGGGARFLDLYRTELMQSLLSVSLSTVEVMPAELGDVAGAVGAAAWVAGLTGAPLF